MNPQPPAAEVHRRYGGDRYGGDRYGGTIDRNAPSGGYGEDYLAYEKANEAAFLRLQERSLDDAGFYDVEGELFARAPAVARDPATAATREQDPSRPAVLDIGSATGALLLSLARRNWHTTGVEISLPQAAYARARGLTIQTLPLEENHFAPESFDAVLASHLIEHLTDPASFVRELYRVVKTGGRIYLTTPNSAGFQARLFRGRWRSAIFDHLYLFSTVTLSRLLEQNGFTVEKRITWGGLAEGTVPAPIKRAADRIAKRCGVGDVMILRAVKQTAVK
jgi:SAM-dependent methyltransferase